MIPQMARRVKNENTDQDQALALNLTALIEHTRGGSRRD